MIYDYYCAICKQDYELMVKVAARNSQQCRVCGSPLRLRVSAPYGRVGGRTLKGGGPDRFTADALGIKLNDLPPALRADYKG